VAAALGQPAPQLQVAEWLNTPEPLTLAGLRGRVVVIEAFQMLCPGCVHHGLPQAQRVAEAFDAGQVCVLGLHTVFEHHAVQGTAAALRAFMHENRIRFPVGIDMPGDALPRTMAAYGMQGTPTVLVIDGDGVLHAQHFGAVPDLVLGAQIGALVAALR
jgi:thiol-disulfide isomerase/thioredoxin